MNPNITDNPSVTLEQLLRRNDLWRGRSANFAPQLALDTGYAPLNTALLNKGWPLGSLIEICQRNLSHSEWLLLTPALLATEAGYIVLLNPPARPFAQGLIQAGLDLDRLLIVQTRNKADFLASFSELVRSDACDAVLAWQPSQPLSYTELRKCLLATADGQGLYVLFRAAQMQQQSSPATLRLFTDIQAGGLHVRIFKQKGVMQQQQSQAITLPLPQAWLKQLPHYLLDQVDTSREAGNAMGQDMRRTANPGTGKTGKVPPRHQGTL